MGLWTQRVWLWISWLDSSRFLGFLVFFPAAVPPPGWEDITWVYSFGHLWSTMTATWCACLGNEGIVASRQENEAHILNQDLHFCCCGPFFSCLLNVRSWFSCSWPKSCELAGAFKAFHNSLRVRFFCVGFSFWPVFHPFFSWFNFQQKITPPKTTIWNLQNFMALGL